MKKYFLLIALFVGLIAKAETNLSIVPFTIPSGTAGESGYFDINMNNDECQVTSLTIDIYMPAGIRIYTNNSGNLVGSSMALNASRATYFNEDEEDDVTAFSSASGHNFKHSSDGEYYEWAGAGQWPVAGTSGKLFTGRYKLSANVADGIYPIRMDCYVRNADGIGNRNVTTYSYVVVGNPTSADMVFDKTSAALPPALAPTFEKEIPSVVMSALNSQDGLTSLNLAEIVSIEGSYQCVDGRAVVAPTADIKVNASYERTVAQYGSVILPYDVADGTFYVYKETAGGFATFTQQTGLAANTPAIVDGNISVSASNVSLTDVSKHTATMGYYLKGSSLLKCNNTIINPYRTEFTAITGDSEVRGFILETPDGVQKIIAPEDVDGDIYNLGGVRLAKAQKNAVNIINGKKILK